MKRHIYTKALYIIGISVGVLTVRAQGQQEACCRTLTYTDFLEQVSNHNLEYAAEKLNVSIAEAEAVAANVYNDPQLSVEYFNNEQNKLQMGYGVSVELSQTVSFGKRSAAVKLARSEKELTKALLEDYFRTLRADATIAYLDALKQYQLYQVKQNAYENLYQLAQSDSIRHRLGKIMEVDAIQSKLEAHILQNELLQASAEMRNTFATLALYTGTVSADTLYCPQAALREKDRDFILGDLISTATLNRTDLVAALKNVDVAKRAIKVAQRERNLDIDLSLGVSRNARVLNEEAPAPPFTGVTAGIGIPLKFSNLNKGAVHAAKFRAEQAEMQYRQAVLQVQTEVMQAYRQYQSFSEQVRHYENGMLQQAKLVLDGKIYSYNRGEVSLLEVLNAQRTYDDVQTLYYETLFNYTSALVELEKNVGMWDITLTN